MGLQDRDWFRDEPSPEWNNLVRGMSESPHARRTSGAAYAPRRRSRFVFLRRGAIVAAIVLVAFVAWDLRATLGRVYDSAAKNSTAQPPRKHSLTLSRG